MEVAVVDGEAEDGVRDEVGADAHVVLVRGGEVVGVGADQPGDVVGAEFRADVDPLAGAYLGGCVEDVAVAGVVGELQAVGAVAVPFEDVQLVAALAPGPQGGPGAGAGVGQPDVGEDGVAGADLGEVAAGVAGVAGGDQAGVPEAVRPAGWR